MKRRKRMKAYQHIVVAVELIPENDAQPIAKAVELAKEYQAKLTLLHVVEHVSSYGAAYGVAVGTDIEQILIDNAKTAMTQVGKTLNVAADDQIIRLGPPGIVILEEAEKLKADLIIVGSHGRHGIRLLLGSTANAVLHGAKCDVLAVRLQE
jgi:universal stress protein A